MRLAWWACLAGICAVGCEDQSALEMASGDPQRGAAAISRVGCAACHDIPGVRGPSGQVGPSLAGFAGRTMIAGTLPNRADLLAIFVRDAPSLVPETGMPPLPLDQQEARDVASFLYTLH